MYTVIFVRNVNWARRGDGSVTSDRNPQNCYNMEWQHERYNRACCNSCWFGYVTVV